MDDVVALSRLLGVAKQGPKPIPELAKIAELVYGEPARLTVGRLLKRVAAEGEGGDLRKVLGDQFAKWDHEPAPAWADHTTANSASRRARIYDLLAIDTSARQLLDDRLPVYPIDPPTVIAAEGWEPWYNAERRLGRTFYWDAFAGYLRHNEGWPEASMLSLDESTSCVVERLTDPLQTKVYQAKGLVVGYVQSGKTANITGVVAKAADAGYRLIIVLAGTLDLLRNQTQRRVDRELVGAELLEDEYVDAADWDQFLRHGASPSALGAFDLVRLTTRTSDYRRLPAGAVGSLRFERSHMDKPFNHPDNLHESPAKLLVVKKHATVLDRVAKDLARINQGKELDGVPALVIDDESDQASVNTLRPSKDQNGGVERTRINKAIVGLLETLPRGQYVGYTATPFANVFVDPSDGADLFPRDFLIGLPRPIGYLGAGDFHDLDGTPPGMADYPYRSNERAFVRPIYGGDADRGLLQALDSFLLAGAIKLFRQERSDSLRFRHHTMMVHTSQRNADQVLEAALTRKLLDDAGYETGAGLPRLRELFLSDFAPVCIARGSGLPLPGDFDELESQLGETLARLERGGSPVLLINSMREADQLAFDTEPVWKIIVGGAKLSRGFTIEGLTTSYFRRRSPTADTLMQMGRWCGFRDGYRDLVRLFIGRSEIQGRNVIDVYEAFEAVCRDEESFREELKRYALPKDGKPLITPRDIPPLVASHLEWVRPTSRDKMFNATIAYRNFGDQWAEHRRVAQSDQDKVHNASLFRELLQPLKLSRVKLEADGKMTEALVGLVSADIATDAFGKYRWADRQPLFQQELGFLAGDLGDPAIRDWAVIMPQLKKPTVDATWKLGTEICSVHFRSYWNNEQPLVNAYAGPDDRAVARVITSKQEPAGVSAGLAALRKPKRGVILIYPIVHERKLSTEWVPTIGFSVLFPPNDIERVIGFKVRVKGMPNEAVVDAPSSG